jgi:pantoate kinase
MREASAFSPGHITGFFQICDEPEDLLLKGSRGAGVCLSKGIHTTVQLEPTARNSLKVKINGCLTDSAVVSEYVAKTMLSRTKENYRIIVNHQVEVPIGRGMGTSGAGALSLAMALNEALGLSLSREEVGQVAHIADAECRTGLGTVIAEAYGSMEIRVKPGAPGVGEILKVPLRGEYVVVCLPFGSISTRTILTDEVYRKRINELGDLCVKELLSKPTPEEFMRLSRSFAEHVGLITERVRAVLKEADEAGLPCSMPMFGEAAFSLLRRGDTEDLLEIFQRHQAPGIRISEIDEGLPSIILAEVDETGVRLI